MDRCAERLDGRTVLLLFLTVLALAVVDAVLSQTLLGTMLPTVVADVGVALAVLVARRHLLFAALLTTAVSTAVSVAVSSVTVNHWLRGHQLLAGNSIVGAGAFPGLGELAGMAVLCVLVMRSRPAVEATTAAVAYGWALLAIVTWRQQGLWGGLFLLVLGVAFAATMATGVYSRWIEQRRTQEARATRQAERDAIARELHDLVAHHVTGIVVQAQAARLVAASRPDVTVSALSSIERAGADALSSMRAMVGALRADDGDTPLAPTATLDDIRQLASSNGIAPPVVVSVDESAGRLPGSVMASLHRIAIEAVTNARRHGTGATTVDVDVVCSPPAVTLSVTNDGAVVTERRPGFGLVGIAERVAALGGRFEAGPRPTGGWRVVAELPMDVVGAG